MDLFTDSNSDSSSAHHTIRRGRRLRNARNRRRVVSDDMDVDYDINLENTDSEALDVVMKEPDNEDKEKYNENDVDETTEVEKMLVGTSDEDFENDNSHFPRLFGRKISDGGDEDPYLSDSAVGEWSTAGEWVYTIDMQGPLAKFSELSAKKAQKKKEARAEEHRKFWADKKDHGLEDIQDRLQRFSDEVSSRIPEGDKASGILESFSDEMIEEMEKFLKDFDLSAANLDSSSNSEIIARSSLQSDQAYQQHLKPEVLKGPGVPQPLVLIERHTVTVTRIKPTITPGGKPPESTHGVPSEDAKRLKGRLESYFENVWSFRKDTVDIKFDEHIQYGLNLDVEGDFMIDRSRSTSGFVSASSSSRSHPFLSPSRSPPPDGEFVEVFSGTSSVNSDGFVTRA
ncbi:hypothetical protein GGU10DRAFT_379624 [Lentinula aff. detonsa]|uniref:Uncharacterized protein n=1 Tax=Lentinula aff. detonsa TaxID=2804958 RepID=A0AA38NHN4_9AGAR|nr:hypothetical protein GGU10DRAFT_379624 [Lentinula aff. detonsa]